MVAALLHICNKFGLEPGQLTLGIVGAGHVGSKVFEAARAMGFNVLINDPPRQRREKAGEFVSLGHLASESDIISFHVPLTRRGRDATLHLAGKEFISKMKQGSFLINTSRGGVTDEKDVKRALVRGTLGGYIADVWSGEPVADKELISMALIATPHIAGYSADSKLNATIMALHSFKEFFRIPVALPHPDLLPKPANTFPDYTGIKGTTISTLNDYITHTYNIISDSEGFKANPDDFEKQRNNYPLRREFGAYMVYSEGKESEILIKLGFNARQRGNL
jgi:erythronate-4-phosphate dehydrogenase